MVARSAIRNLGRELVQELGVSLRVDFTAEQTRSALDRELAHFPPQAFARARGFARHFLVRLRDEPLRLARGRSLGVLDDFIRTFSRQIDDLRGAIARGASALVDVLIRVGGLAIALALLTLRQLDLLALELLVWDLRE